MSRSGDPLAGFDLNLLLVLRALVDGGSVRAAARRVGLSPSAASHALARLRELVGDPLFERVGNRMVPTPRAAALAGPVSRALDALSHAFAPPPFDPAAAEGSVRIAAVDLAQVLVLPALLARVTALAPGVQVVVVHLPHDPPRSLAQGDVDLVLGGPMTTDAFPRAVVWTEPFVCVVRAGHPCLAEPWTPEAYAALPHVLVQPRGNVRGHVDRALAAVGLARRVACVTPGLDLAARVVARSELVLTTTRRGAAVAAERYGLHLRPPPLPVDPYSLTATWRPGEEPLHRWVRDLLREVDPVPEDLHHIEHRS